MTSLHRRYAEEITVLGGISSPALRQVLRRVRREDFLPAGPWLIESLDGRYYPSDDANVSQILHGVGVALDPSRGLNNANPVKILMQLQAVDLQPNETVFHVGAGGGYYTAIMAELVGRGGRVIAAEIDDRLRSVAAAALAAWPQVTLVADALAQDLPPVDLLFASAGLSGVPPGWARALRPGGRMILPITGAHDHGAVFLFRHTGDAARLSASVLSFTRYYPCQGHRAERAVAALSVAFARPVSAVASLRLDPHPAAADCWLHGDGACLSQQPSQMLTTGNEQLGAGDIGEIG